MTFPANAYRPSVPLAPLTIWCDQNLTSSAEQLLRENVGATRLLFRQSGAATSWEAPVGQAQAIEAEIAFGQPSLADVEASPRLRWVHLSSAGYTRFDTPEARTLLNARGIALSTSSAVYDDPCAQHVLAMMLANARQLPRCWEDQRTASWNTAERRGSSVLLGGQTILLLGFGAIARRLVALLRPFEMRIVAQVRTLREYEGVEFVEPGAPCMAVMAEAGHVVNILPESAETHSLCGSAFFSGLNRGAHFYNIGRGATVDESALVTALTEGRLGSAYLDVTQVEPLLPDHPLWRTPNCRITPHSGGGHRGEQDRLVRHFLRNLQAWQEGRDLVNRVI